MTCKNANAWDWGDRLTIRISHDMSDAPSPAHRVVIDACVLMPTILRRLLLRVADQGCFEPVWSARIGEEWRRNAARLWDIPLADLQQEWNDMNARFPCADPGDCSAYETGLRYSDPKDWHVIAAGLASRARCGLARTPTVSVMTWNLKDFNRSELKRQAVHVASPDALLSRWFEEFPEQIMPAFDGVLADASLVGRPADDLAQALHKERLFRLANLVQARQTASKTHI